MAKGAEGDVLLRRISVVAAYLLLTVTLLAGWQLGSVQLIGSVGVLVVIMTSVLIADFSKLRAAGVGFRLEAARKSTSPKRAARRASASSDLAKSGKPAPSAKPAIER